jgi:hypothetical protein
VQEKEDPYVVNEILAKLNAHEKMFGAGAVVLIVGWLVGLILANYSVCVAGSCFGSFNWFTHEHGMDLGLIALLAAIGGIALLYLKYAPNTNITWPAPLPMIMFGVGVVALACAALVLLLGVLDAKDVLGEAPIFWWVADIALVVGGALMAYPTYLDWQATK